MNEILYLGPDGSNAHIAALHVQEKLALDDYKLQPTETISQSLEMAAAKNAGIAVVPWENSLGGDVNEAFETFAKLNLFIQGCYPVPIRHSLHINKEVESLDDLEVLASHYQGFRQASRYIRAQLPGNLKLEKMPSTAGAVLRALDNPRVAAIGTPIVAEINGIADRFNIIHDIQDDPNNTTTFILAGRKPLTYLPICNDETTMIVDLSDKAGSLLEVLELGKVNYTKIKSFGRAGNEVRFLLSMDGHQSQPEVKRFLEDLEEKAKKVDIRGSYPKVEYVPKVSYGELNVQYARELLQEDIVSGKLDDQNYSVIMFSLANRPGELVRALRIFADINLNVIDSLPSGRLNEYIFYLAFENHLADKNRLVNELQTTGARIFSL